MTTATEAPTEAPTTTTGIHHFAIKVRDLPAAERFYREVLGLAVQKRWPAAGGGGGDRSVWLSTGDGAGTFLALEVATDPRAPDRADHAEGEPPGHHLLALRIPLAQRARWEERLAAAGVPVSHRSPYTIYFTDPEGNRLGLSHHPDPDPAGPA
ncbi:MAG: VOC family protein [Bacteroidota bacterium]